LPPITGEASPVSRAFISRSRGLREAIHMSSFLLSFICMYVTGNVLTASLILFVAVLYAFSELARVRGINLPLFSSVTWNAANKTELYEFAAAPIHFALGIAISLLVFPEPICYVAITALTLGDGCAHILGRKFSRTPLPFNKGKSIEGTVFGFLFAFLGARFFVNTELALIGAAVGMLVEGLPSPINDNLTIPLVTGLALMLVV
jgi:dolichol kinase